MPFQPSLIERDLNHIWHPCTVMKDLEQFPPFIVHRAAGSYLQTDQGPIIDAISSWWCKSLGHGHPAVIAAIQQQLTHFEHVIGANATYPAIVELAEQLYALSDKQHVFFASDGSCAVEIALKLALQAMQLQGKAERNQFISLRQSYHGETIGTLSVSDLAEYKKPFNQWGLTCHFLDAIPYVANDTDPLWRNCETFWPVIEQQLERIKAVTCAIIVEPIVQGAGGMHCYSADFLQRLANWAKINGIYLIADEIMTGLCRTGTWLACQHAHVNADMICLSKGLTSGSLPLSCVLIDHTIYDLFYEEYQPGRAFLHSHTYSGNPLAVAAALATIQIMHREQINQQTQILGDWMQLAFNQVATQTGKLTRIRHIGGIIAADLLATSHPRIGQAVAKAALQRGALLRPLGNTVYWLPPLTTEKQTIEQLAEITYAAIKVAYSE